MRVLYHILSLILCVVRMRTVQLRSLKIYLLTIIFCHKTCQIINHTLQYCREIQPLLMFSNHRNFFFAQKMSVFTLSHTRQSKYLFTLKFYNLVCIVAFFRGKNSPLHSELGRLRTNCSPLLIPNYMTKKIVSNVIHYITHFW